MGNGLIHGIGKFFKGVFGSRDDRLINDMVPIVEHINDLEAEMEALSDEALKAKTDEFKERLAKGETLDDLLPEAFAVVREASKRTTGMRHFDVQLMGGMVLHRGMIAEMVTGEGKTLVATLPAYLNALTGRGVHIVTVNDYLAHRDRDWMGPIYEFLGMSVGVIVSFMPKDERKAAYACDITYGQNNEFGFDYLRDNMEVSLDDQVQRELHYAIVDEVDSILIDEARTPLIISGPAFESTDRYYQAEQIARRLKRSPQYVAKKGDTLESIAKKFYGDENKSERIRSENTKELQFGTLNEGADLNIPYDYVVREKEHSVHLTEQGIEKAQKLLGIDNLYTGTNMEWIHYLEQAIRAKELFKRDKDYIVTDGKVVIIDEFTGRMMEGRVWSDGLHQAVEAKEHLKIKQETQTLATITFQNYFKLYDKIAGMTGTAKTEEMEFYKIYKLEVVVIPTNKPLIREQHPDAIYLSQEEKWQAVVDEIVRVHNEGRPILVGTTSIENSEKLSSRLQKEGIEHEVLNAKQHAREAQIIAKAGQQGNVTIATNMAGRGTDIVLGDGVADLGGLYVLGTERHESRRIDNQLRGRTGRQGDPGSNKFFISLKDDMMRIFAPEWMGGLFGKLGMGEGIPLEHKMVTRAIEKAQKRVEDRNFDIRKDLLEYDEVMNEQRKLIYSQRQEILRGENVHEMLMQMVTDVIDEAVETYMPKKALTSEWDYDGIAQWAKNKFGIDVAGGDLTDVSRDNMADALLEKVEEKYRLREERYGAREMQNLERFILLQVIDVKWKDHLYGMDQLKSGIGLRGYAQKDPKLEYKREGYMMFEEMMYSIAETVTDLFLKVEIQKEEELELSKKNVFQDQNFIHAEQSGFASQASWSNLRSEKRKEIDSTQTGEAKGRTFVRTKEKVGRNDPCPCGSGKKYKKCCGRNA